MRARVLCFGGRDYADAAAVNRALSSLLDNIYFDRFVLINGGAPGADRLCKEWGLSRGHPVITMDAAWQALGKAAGGVRNGWMIEIGLPNYAVGFPGGRGTADMAAKLRAANVPLWAPFGLSS